jgi:hypothetical protein
MIQHTGMCPTGPDFAQIVLQCFHSFIHALISITDNIFGHRPTP